MEIKEQILRIKGLIFELSSKSEGVKEFFDMIGEYPELLAHLKFKDIKSLREYVRNASYEDFTELRNEIEGYFKIKKTRIRDEMDDIKTAVDFINQEGGINISVDDLLVAFENAKEIQLTPEVWKKIENTDSTQINQGDMKKVGILAKKYNKTSPLKLKKLILSGDYERPLVIKIGNKYRLVSGNIKLSTAAALGVMPKILLGVIELPSGKN